MLPQFFQHTTRASGGVEVRTWVDRGRALDRDETGCALIRCIALAQESLRVRLHDAPTVAAQTGTGEQESLMVSVLINCSTPCEAPSMILAYEGDSYENLDYYYKKV